MQGSLVGLGSSNKNALFELKVNSNRIGHSNNESSSSKSGKSTFSLKNNKAYQNHCNF